MKMLEISGSTSRKKEGSFNSMVLTCVRRNIIRSDVQLKSIIVLVFFFIILTRFRKRVAVLQHLQRQMNRQVSNRKCWIQMDWLEKLVSALFTSHQSAANRKENGHSTSPREQRSGREALISSSNSAIHIPNHVQFLA